MKHTRRANIQTTHTTCIQMGGNCYCLLFFLHPQWPWNMPWLNDSLELSLCRHIQNKLTSQNDMGLTWIHRTFSWQVSCPDCGECETNVPPGAPSGLSAWTAAKTCTAVFNSPHNCLNKAAVSQQLNHLASNTSLQSAGKTIHSTETSLLHVSLLMNVDQKDSWSVLYSIIRHVDCDTLDQNQGREYIIYPSYATAINTHTMFTFTYCSCD